MDNSLSCPNEARKARVRDLDLTLTGTLNAIDFLDVLDDEAPAGSPRQRTLLVHCFRPVAGLAAENVRIEGGVRVGPIGVLWAAPADAVPAALASPAERAFFTALPDASRVLVVRTDSAGDFSTYTLRLVRGPSEPDVPPSGFDRPLAAIDFSFKVDCPSEFDCRTTAPCPFPVGPSPAINYLARDFEGFRGLLLDRLAVTVPGWRERNPADLGIVLTELLAYAGDGASYFLDAVATEAYLGTARRRVSVRRHARLVDYAMHDGANARAWVCVEVAEGRGADGLTLPTGTVLLSQGTLERPTVAPRDLADALSGRPVVFETRHSLTLDARRNEIAFYTWGDPDCCLPRGATSADLLGKASDLGLRAGDVLIFEEVRGPVGDHALDPGLADPSHRAAVRLDAPPVARLDPLTGAAVASISWFAGDALPFALCLREVADPEGGAPLRASVARGNVVLADHGLSIAEEPLVPDVVPPAGKYRPRLGRDGLTQAMPYDDALARTLPAAAATVLDLDLVRPAATLHSEGAVWQSQRDLLQSDRFAAEFVVETENDASAAIRFGDGILGRLPTPGAAFSAVYRVGNGRAGNVGADALSRVVTPLTERDITRVRNPLPAVGGTDPEAIDRVRLRAPQAFRVQERAITEEDYAEVARRHPEVARAAATRRWTGSWYTIFVTIDRNGGRAVDLAFRREVRDFLERFRMMGYDVEVDAPRFVPLDIALTVCTAPGFFRAHVKQALLETFGSAERPDGSRGFFHPDNFTFGQPVYLSQIVAAAMSVPGVASVLADPAVHPFNHFRRRGDVADASSLGILSFDRLEIARLDNDPNAPENGKIDFDMKGGL